MEQAPSQGSTKLKDGLALIRVPMHFKRRGGRKAMVLPPEGTARASSGGPIDPLVSTLARAHVWLRWLETRRFRSISALARAEGVDEAYVRRGLRLTFLAPDIVEAILGGNEPGGLPIKALVQAPIRWDAQRRALGFAKELRNSAGVTGRARQSRI